MGTTQHNTQAQKKFTQYSTQYSIVAVNKENDIYTANVVVPNEKINLKKKLTDFVVPIEMIEKLTGFVFLPKLKQLNLKNLYTDNIRKCKLPLTWQEM
ncbi:hypothetical protein A3Q56_03053 [Intoshia linei]|uniref:Uncharacterized protein n=1 Tax=Intoshia linei TaxID=1819745 RepID=A0A177B517_9BILA|nr:hypothetical protein A3Q56_03053 [Intoshia linei]